MIISVFNQKGGCGKSTTASNLAAYTAKHGKRTLLVDMDPQANATVSVGVDDEELKETVFDLLSSKEVRRERVLEVIQETSYPRLYVLPSDITLGDAEITLSSAINREKILKRILETVDDYYDYIVIDCPPTLGLLSINSLVASEYLIIPVTPQFFSIKGIKHLINTYNLVKDNLNPDLEIMGVLITMFDSRKNIAKDIRKTLVDVFGNKVFETVIRVDSKVEYSQDNQRPIIHYFKNCHAYEDYTKFGREVMEWSMKKVEA